MAILETTNERYWSGTNNNPKWTKEKVEELKSLLQQDLSAAQLAKRLGFGTRNAIIGKLKRLGLRLPNEVSKKGHPKKNGQEGPHLTRRRRLRIVLKEPQIEEVSFVDCSTQDYDQAIPISQRKTLLELSSFTCRWPVGNPGQAGFFFCGATTHQTYCKHHTKRALRA